MMEDNERRLVETEARSKSNSHRLDKLEQNTEAVQKLATSVELMAQSMEGMRDEQKDQGERLSVLEKVPGEQWSSMKRTIFTSAVSTISGGVVGAIITVLMMAMSVRM